MKFRHFFTATVLPLFFSTMVFSQETNLKENFSAYLPEVRMVNQVLSKSPAQTILTKDGLENARKGMMAFAPKNTVLKPSEKFIKGPVGDIRVVILKPDTVRAVVLDIHGGGWSVGTPEADAGFNDAMARACNVAIISPDYRLAPEHPFPACIEDCKAIAKWLVANAKAEFGTDKIFVSGNSAGAHIAAVITLYIRDSLKAIDMVKGVNLVYGCYDLGRTPSCRQATDSSFLSRKALDEVWQLVFRGMNTEQLQNPVYSPLYAGLRGLPPALFTIGLSDPLADDTFFMEARWRSAGNKTYLAAYPESGHGVDIMPTKMAKLAREKMHQWMNNLLQ